MGMISESDCFFATKDFCQISNELERFIKRESFLDFTALADDDNGIFFSDPFIKFVYDTFPQRLMRSPRIWKWPAKTKYFWHKDANNGCSINCVLKDYKSLTIFTDIESYTNNLEIKSIVTLSYEPNRWYVFNSQMPHAIINYGDEDRYTVVLSFNRELGISFQEVVDWYKNHSKI